MIEEGEIAPHKKSQGNWVNGVEAAADEIEERIGTKKYKKRLFLITDGESKTPASQNKIDKLAQKLIGNEIKLNAITIGFGDEEDDSQETANQKANSQLLKSLVEQVEGRIFPADLAVSIYKQFQRRAIYPVAKYRGWWNISEKAKVAVRVFGKTREEKLPSLKKYSLVAEPSKDINEGKVKMDRTYALADDPDLNPIDEDYRVKGYYYGKQFVPIPEHHEDTLKYKQDKCLKLLGFAPSSQVPHQLYLAGVDIVLGVDECASNKAFSALVRATKAKDSVAICRFVYQNGRSPKLVCLTPVVKDNYDCFYMNYLPSVEDIRDYQFKSLKPSTKKQLDVTSKFISALNLMEGQEDEDGDLCESLNVKQTFNPVLQHFNDCLNHRAFHPEDEKLPQVNPEISSYLRPDRGLFERAAKESKSFANAFPLKVKSEEDIKGAKKARVCWKELLSEGLNKTDEMARAAAYKEQAVDANAAGKAEKGMPDIIPIKKISSVSPIDDFNRMINDKHEDLVKEAMEQMQDVIDTFVQGALMGDMYEKAKDCVETMREGAVREDEANLFNAYLRGMKSKTRSDKNVREFMAYLRDEGITLISKTETTSSSVLPKEAKEFWKEEAQGDVVMKGVEEDEDDMMDLID